MPGFRLGDDCEAKWGRVWYAARVRKVAAAEPRYLVHYLGWKAHFDEWLRSTHLRAADGADEATAAEAPKRPAAEGDARSPRRSKRARKGAEIGCGSVVETAASTFGASFARRTPQVNYRGRVLSRDGDEDDDEDERCWRVRFEDDGHVCVVAESKLRLVSDAAVELGEAATRHVQTCTRASGHPVHSLLGELVAEGKLVPGPIRLIHHRCQPTRFEATGTLLESGAIVYEGVEYVSPNGFVQAALRGRKITKCNPYHVLYTSDEVCVQHLRTAGRSLKRGAEDSSAAAARDAAPRTPPKRPRNEAAWTPTRPRDVRERLGLKPLQGDDDDDAPDEAYEAFRALSVVTGVGDRRQSDKRGRGVLFASGLEKGARVVDPGVTYHAGAAPDHLSPYEYIQLGSNGHFLLRDRPKNVCTLTFYINEARGDVEPNVSWSVVRPTAGGLAFAWKLTRDVKEGEEVLAAYMTDASEKPKAPRPKAPPKPPRTPKPPRAPEQKKAPTVAVGCRVRVRKLPWLSPYLRRNGTVGVVEAYHGVVGIPPNFQVLRERYDIRMDDGERLEKVALHNIEQVDDAPTTPPPRSMDAYDHVEAAEATAPDAPAPAVVLEVGADGAFDLGSP